MNTEITIPPRRSLLANSSPEILKSLECEDGTLQVVWIPQIDSHGLFFTHHRDMGTHLLGTHHNGYSCRALAERIAAGDHQRAVAQLEFLKQCGGTATDERFLPTYRDATTPAPALGQVPIERD